MGSSLVILNGDFSKNAIYVFCRMLVKAGTQVSIPVKKNGNTLFTMEADARNLDENTYFEFQVPEEYVDESWSAHSMFKPSINPSANNILELNIDVAKSTSGAQMCYQNTGLKKVVLFSKEQVQNGVEFASAFQSTPYLEELDTSNVKWGTNPILFPISCSRLKKANVALNSAFTITAGDYLANNCSSLEELNLTGWRFTAQTTWTSAFDNCSKLRKIYIDDADSAAILISALAAVSSAHVDGSATTYDSANKVINVVHNV